MANLGIKQAKGGKDRIVMLSPKQKKSLRQLSNNSNGLVFVLSRNLKYSTRTIEHIIKNSAKNQVLLSQ
ncbi:MAG: hypothetical protein V1859_11095 [archaeon]